MILIIPPRFCCIEAVQQRRNERETFGSPATNILASIKETPPMTNRQRFLMALTVISVLTV